MAWYDEAIFYHIYPLGLMGCPHENSYDKPVSRLKEIKPWIDHIKETGFNAIYIGPLFESVGHGYETTDYMKLDSRLGTNEDLKEFMSTCHEKGIKVILDGVFNHTGRDFFAFKDIREKRENSKYLGWYSGVNLGGNNSFNDGFSYDNWGGYDLLVRLNQKNPEVQGYIADVIRYWVKEFDIDGLRLDAADVLDFEFMQMLRRVADEVKPDFYLMGEVIHGEYIRWERDARIHAVTNYHLHKALYSGHNEHNYFEIAHTVKRLYDMGGCNPLGLRLYNFADNHDVERIYSRLNNKQHFMPLHILMYTLPGIPSVYYGSEFAIEGKKGGWDDWAIRPALDLKVCSEDEQRRPYYELIKALCHIRQALPVLSYGVYEQLLLTNRQYVFARKDGDDIAIAAVNNDENPAWIDVNVPAGVYKGMLSGKEADASNGMLHVELKASNGDIFVKTNDNNKNIKIETGLQSGIEAGVQSEIEPVVLTEIKDKEETETDHKKQDYVNNIAEVPESNDHAAKILETSVGSVAVIRESTKEENVVMSTQDGVKKDPSVTVCNKPYEEMTVEELQAAIIQKMSKNGPVTDDMRRSVNDNVWHDSLVNWVKSFR
ncbi:MAG: alpha-amylase [Lachnospiraceae bacterium]|nr:alpha-amylase [Lachnospiraceae bacterium]